MPRKPTAKSQTKSVSKTEEKPQCYIHDEVGNVEAVEIREKVCVSEVDYPRKKHSDGNYYCLFHHPTKEKNISKFEEIFERRLQAVWKQVSGIEKLPIDQQNQTRRDIPHDFRYVWFPSWVNLSELIFESNVNFSYATFSGQTDFWSSTFKGTANFNSAIFNDRAKFSSATKFKSIAYFGRATFNDQADFSLSIFSHEANFSSATFSAFADFSSAIFSSASNFELATFSAEASFISSTFTGFTNFGSATFGEKSQIFFKSTVVSYVLSFKYTKFKGYVAFEGKQDNQLFIEENSLLSMVNARIDDAKKISFHIVRLELGWFINADVTEFVFTDCKWRYTNGKDLNVKEELENLKKRGFENPNALLTKACWHLADNHEESKSFPKASLFRQIANESKRLEDYKGWKVWSLHWWYWFSSFYGESPLRAGLVLVGILLLFAVAFMFADFQVCPIVKTIPETACEARTLNVWESALQSLATATFQSIEYIKPNSMATTFLIILEKILAPVQAALLALAIRRKFMR